MNGSQVFHFQAQREVLLVPRSPWTSSEKLMMKSLDPFNRGVLKLLLLQKMISNSPCDSFAALHAAEPYLRIPSPLSCGT